MKKLCTILLLLIFCFIGCSDAKKTYNDALEKSNNSDEPFEYKNTFTGEVIETGSNPFKYVSIAINGDEDYIMEISEYSLGMNNTASGRDENGDYEYKLPNFEIGDKIKVETGYIQVFENNKKICTQKGAVISQIK